MSTVDPARIIIDSESACTTFGGQAGEDGGGVLIPATSNCPAGSSLEYSVDGGTFGPTAPSYDQLNALSIVTRCTCDSDSAVTSSASTAILTTPGACPGCPDLSTVIASPITIVSESNCFTFGAGTGSGGGGILAAPTTACPTGSQTLYSVDGGAFSSSLPAYNQTSSQSIVTICSCLTDSAVQSQSSSAVVTAPGECPPPAAMACSLEGSGPACTGDSDASVSITLVGGAAPYTATLSSAGTTISSAPISLGDNNDVFTGLAAGDYTVKIQDASGAICTSNYTVLDPPAFVAIGGSANDTEGYSGNILPVYYNSHQFSIGGGTPPYNYDFDRTGYVRYGVDELNDPTYDEQLSVIYADDAEWSFTVTDSNGCEVETSVIFSNDDGNGAGTGTTNPDTPGTILDIDAVAITADSYAGGGTGTISLTMAGCNGGPYAFEWSGPGVPGTDYCVACQNQVALESGHYEVTVTCQDGQSTSGYYWVPLDRRSGRLKDAAIAAEFSLTAFPNPMTNSTTVEIVSDRLGVLDLSLYAIDGRVVFSQSVNITEFSKAHTLKIDREKLGLAQGVYSLRVSDSEGTFENLQLLILE